jgi:hypothetical protein
MSGIVAMDLSKAFDCMSPSLLIAKLAAYGMNDSGISLLASYLTNRKQRVKLSSVLSTWLEILKGVPQGSILGPILFNLFINDLFEFIKKCKLYNYADDNTISVSGKTVSEIKETLCEETAVATDWFKNNEMCANPEKCQTMLINGKNQNAPFTIKVNDIHIEEEDRVTLLGIDLILTPNSHSTNI